MLTKAITRENRQKTVNKTWLSFFLPRHSYLSFELKLMFISQIDNAATTTDQRWEMKKFPEVDRIAKLGTLIECNVNLLSRQVIGNGFDTTHPPTQPLFHMSATDTTSDSALSRLCPMLITLRFQKTSFFLTFYLFLALVLSLFR